MLRFGLAVALPKRPDHFLIPSLLSDDFTTPPGWHVSPSAPQLRIHFFLEAEQTGGQVIYFVLILLYSHPLLPRGRADGWRARGRRPSHLQRIQCKV